MFSYNIEELRRQDRKLWNLSVSQSRCVNMQLALCPFCWLVFIKEWWKGRHRDSQGKDTLPLSLHSQRCKEKRNSSKCICQRFFFSWWGFCHFLRPKVSVIKRAVPASFSSQGPKGTNKGGLFALSSSATGFIVSSHVVPLLRTLKEAEHGKKERAEQNCWEALRRERKWGGDDKAQWHASSTTSHILLTCFIFIYQYLDPQIKPDTVRSLPTLD